MENIMLYFLVCVVGFLIGCAIYRFVIAPRGQKIAQMKEWLIYAVAAAEKTFGSQTGELKLHYVYDAFLTKFPILAAFITFEEFKGYVDEALKQFKEMLEKNPAIEEAITK